MNNPFAKPAQRVAVFLDAQNIYHSAKNIFRTTVDFGKLVDFVVGERQLVRAISYVIKSDLNSKEVSFFDALIHKGIDLRIKDLLVFNTGEKKADWDVGMAVDAVRLSHLVDVIILVTGDGDFIPLVEYLKAQGNQVEVAGFSQNTSSKLKEVADFYYDLSESSNQLLIKGRRNS